MKRVKALGIYLVAFLIFGTAPFLVQGGVPCPDGDGDGYVVCDGCDSTGKLCGECNDASAAIKPGATEICDGVDNDCDGDVDLADTQFNDPDPIDGIDNDDGGAGDVDEGFGYCVFNVDGPGGECVTGGRSVCQWPVGTVASGVVGFGSLTCVNANNNVILYSDEALASGNSCSNGKDDDCDSNVDLNDTGCQQPETNLCDGLDNDQNGFVDEIFPLADPGNVGQVCEVGEPGSVCERVGVYVCQADGLDAECSATPGNPKNEGTTFGNSCDNGKDDDCDGLIDLDDPDCAGFGDPELCGNGMDDDGDGFVDEGFPTIGLPCAVGVGACTKIGALVCNGDGTGTECDETPGDPGDESAACGDMIDNDCDGLTDAADVDCADEYADLGVTCSLPYTHAYPGGDCTGKHTIVFDGGQSTEVQADLLALAADGSLLGIIEDVQAGDAAHLKSRLKPSDYVLSSKTNSQGTRHTVSAPMPILRVTGKGANGVEDVAYCSIMPYLAVTEPKGETISLSQGDKLSVGAYLPLVDIDTLGILFNGFDLIDELGIDPTTDFPTGGTALCAMPGDCVFQIMAGCGSAAMVDVEISNLRVEGINTDDAPTARDGVEVPEQVNTLSFDVSGLPAGGHIFYITGDPMPLPDPLTVECLVDDLTDTGTASAFGISIESPTDQQVIASAPVIVTGNACGGNEISRLLLQGNSLGVAVPADQTCTTGDGMFVADECYIDFSEAIGETDLGDAADGVAVGGTFKRGSNRVIADASDVRGNRTFNTDVVFGLGSIQAPGAPGSLGLQPGPGLPGDPIQPVSAAQHTGMMLELGAETIIHQAVEETEAFLTATIDPAFVVGLEESAVQDFFNAKCSAAIDQFTARATAALQNKAFGTIDLEPGCSCNLYNVPIVLEQLTFTPSPEDPKCQVDFAQDELSVQVHLPNIKIQVGVHDSCTDHGIFGECIARTIIDVTAVTKLQNLAFGFTITETQIETKTVPDPESFTFSWTVLDNGNNELFLSSGTCTTGPKVGKECFGAAGCGQCVGGDKDGKGCKDNAGCPGGSCSTGSCTGVVKNPAFEPVTAQNSGIECWGATICTAFQVVGAVLIEVFTFGIADGFEIVDFFDFDFEFQEDFFEEIAASDPDAMQLDEVEVNEDTAAEAGNTVFMPGQIDVEIENGGLTVAFPAEFASQFNATDEDLTPGASLSPAATPSVSQVIAAGSEITMLVADDVFGQMYASMKEAGQLTAFCTDLDGRTVDDLLPAEMDGGCDSLGEDNLAGATIQGVCHAIRGADCETLLAAGGITQTALKQGVCHGFKDDICMEVPTGFDGIVLPADCDSIGLTAEDSEDPDFEPGRSTLISQGRCHGLQGAICENLTSGGTDQETAFKQGACHGAQGAVCNDVPTTSGAGAQEIGTCGAVQGSCAGLGLLSAAQCAISQLQVNITNTVLRLAEEAACNVTPSKNITGSDGLLLCAAENFEPDLLIREDNTLDNTVQTDLLLNQLDIAFVLDRADDGYTGSTLDLDGCFSAEGDVAPDCLLIGVCLNLTLQTSMGIDSSTCLPNQAGFTFSVDNVISSGSSLGLVCSAPTETDDQLVVGSGFDSVVVTAIENAAESFTPVFCVDGLDLNGVLDFSSSDAKLFGLTTTGATGAGFADYLGITVDLAPAP